MESWQVKVSRMFMFMFFLADPETLMRMMMCTKNFRNMIKRRQAGELRSR